MNMKSYFKNDFLYDLKAGFVTSLLAFPLAIGFAIASGISPIIGIYTAIFAGFLSFIFGGSKFVITAPTSMLIVIILSTKNSLGFEGLFLAGFLSGIILVLFGLFKMGKFFKYIPLPIISGFTCGMGLLIFIRQIPNFLGLQIPFQRYIWEIFYEIYLNLNLINWLCVFIGVITLCILFYLPKVVYNIKYLKEIPASFVALIFSIIIFILVPISVPHASEITYKLPHFDMFEINFELIKEVLPVSFAIAFICAFESILCAVLVDGMTNKKHNSNKELISQGALNIFLPFFGAIPVNSSLTRTTVNIKEGARTRFSGVFHAILLFMIVFFFGFFVVYIPIAFFAALLIFISIKMINISEIKTITHISRADTMVFLITFLLTVFTNIIFAVQVGMFAGIVLLFIKLTDIMNIDKNHKLEEHDLDEGKLKQLPLKFRNKVEIFTINGPFFFGAINIFDSKISEQINFRKKYIILRMKYVPFIDISGIERLKSFIYLQNKQNRVVLLVGLKIEVKRSLFKDKEFVKILNRKHVFERTKDALEFIELSA